MTLGWPSARPASAVRVARETRRHMAYPKLIPTSASLCLIVLLALAPTSAGAASETVASTPAATPAAAASRTPLRPRRRPAASKRRPPPRRSTSMSACSWATRPERGTRTGSLGPGQPQLPPIPHSRAVGEALLPQPASVKAVTAWLLRAGHHRRGRDPDRMTVQASAAAAPSNMPSPRASASTATTAGRAPERRALKVPAAWPLITGVSGVDQNVATPTRLTGAEASARPRRRQSARQRNPPAAGIPQRPALLDLLWQEARHDRPALWRRLPRTPALRRLRLRARRNSRAPTASLRRSQRASTARA